MRGLFVCLFCLVALVVFEQDASAQRRFLFPRIAANRLNAQADANLALARANNAAVIARASRNGFVFQKNAVVFAQPKVVFAQPRVVVAQPAFAYVRPQVVQFQQGFNYHVPAASYGFGAALALPSYQTQVFQAQTFQAASGYCGF